MKHSECFAGKDGAGMEYSIKNLSRLAGVSTRTLRYYDEIGLLSPGRISGNKYRVYGQKEVDLLQQILFYRELGMPLDEIKEIVKAKNYDGIAALEGHLADLIARRKRIDSLIANVEKTISASKGGSKMRDEEKFEGFKQNMIDENERKYGKEIREKYGDAAVDASNAKMMGMTPAQYEEVQGLSSMINEKLGKAFLQGNPSGEEAQEVCELHKKWLCFFWKDYSKEAHMSLAQTYVDDPRFKKYYDDIAPGCAEFLRDAMQIYTSK